MFLFIGGIQPKTVRLEDRSRMCPSCGLYQAYLQRTDQYISLFFIPIIRIKIGTPYIECEKCGSLSYENVMNSSSPINVGKNDRCSNCGNPIDHGFRFCPYCGKEVNG